MFAFKVGDLVTFVKKHDRHHKKTFGIITKVQHLDKGLMNAYPDDILISILINNSKIISCFSDDIMKI